ncbi:ABC transporter substrate-binding protein [Anaerocolumna sp.]|uniref:ABC transporter substrate-binding protein n=1 Tax=Anaerocolumna sp. TaxID=2041569 RepID=UPI0028A5FAF2|nr:ABC transporter substrate-binding protein [Anaerocolumna sp.]
MKKKIIPLLLVICMVVALTGGCGKKNANTSAPSTTETAETPADSGKDNPTKETTGEDTDSSEPKGSTETVIFTDSAGRQVEVPTNITRIAPSGSLAQIVLFALAPDMFVGLAGEWDAEAEQYLDSSYYNLPILGQFYGKGDLNLEEVVKADPQVIIDVGESKSTIAEDMDAIADQVNIPTIHIEATTESMSDAYRELGKLLGREEDAEVLAKYCDEIYAKTQDIINKVGEDGKAKLLYCTGDGLSVLAKGSFHAEILDQVSNNLAVVDDISSKGSGNPVDMEQILLWNPDVILFAPGSIYDTVATDKTWQEVSAVKNNKYFEVPSGPYNWMGTPPSVNRYMGMIWITQLLYPDQAGYNAYEEAARYYDLFYHTKLTEDQYNALVANSLMKLEK